MELSIDSSPRICLMFINMFVNDYKHETSDISGWYFSGHLACFPVWNTSLEKIIIAQ